MPGPPRHRVPWIHSGEPPEPPWEDPVDPARMALFDVEVVEVDGAFVAGRVDRERAAAVRGARAAEMGEKKVGEVDPGV